MDCNYIVWLREHVLTRKNVYKIGNTGDIFNRIKNYPKGSQLLYMSMTPHKKIIETDLIAFFKTKFKHRTDLGREYFQGDYHKMRNLMHSYIDLHSFDFPQTYEIKNDYLLNSAAIKIQYHYRRFLKKKMNAIFKIKYYYKKYLIKKSHAKNNFINDTVLQFIDKEIIDDNDQRLYEKDVKNLFILRHPDLNMNNIFFRDMFQKHLGLLQIRNGKLVWLHKSFGHKIVKKIEDDKWKEYIDNYLTKDDDCFLTFSDLKISFKSWLSKNRKKDKPKIGEIKNYFSKHLNPWMHTKFHSKDVEGYKGWKIINK